MIKTNLAVLMAERGLKISDVYEATGISKTTLMAISDNTGKGIQYETMDKLCSFFNVTPNSFFVYSPYNFNFHVLDSEDTFPWNNLKDIAITVFKSSMLKSFTFSPDVITPMGEFFNVTKKDADCIINYNFAIEIDNEEKSKRAKNEFYHIYDELPTMLKADLNKHFLSLVLKNLSNLNGQTIKVLDGKIDFNNTDEWTHDLTIKNNMKVIVNLFDARFTRLVKVPLFITDSKNINK